MKVLILEPALSERAALSNVICACLPLAPRFAYHAPEDVFRSKLSPDADIAFITVNSMVDVEAARQFRRLYGAVPLIVVSDSTEYAVESFRFPAKGYVKRPASRESILKALCAV